MRTVTPNTTPGTTPAPHQVPAQARRASPTPRLVLRPGVHVLRRRSDELQVGLDPARAIVLPDVPAVRRLLDVLRSPAAPRDGDHDAATLDLLAAAGLLVDADRLLPLVPARSTSGPASATGGHAVARSDVAALAALAGDGTADLLRARSRTSVEVLPTGGADAQRVASLLTRLVLGAGVTLTRLLPQRPPYPKEEHRTPPGLGVLVAVGEPARELLDPWLREGTPHLLLRLVEGHAVVGPFVRPGQTACVRCIDAHHTDVDPAWPLLVSQYAAAVTRGREDAVPEPVDTVLATLAAAWAAREVVSSVEGRGPATASTTIRLDPHLTALETQHWPGHADCGCGWG